MVFFAQKYAFANKIYPYQDLHPITQSTGCFSPFAVGDIVANTRTGQVSTSVSYNKVILNYDGLSNEIDILVEQTNFNPNNLLDMHTQKVKKSVTNTSGKSTTMITLPKPTSNIYVVNITVKNKKQYGSLGDQLYEIPSSTCEVMLAPSK